MVSAFALQSCPSGWIAADGATPLRSLYPKLFAAMGTIHGSGNGSTTFHLPDYRGRFLRMVDGTASVDPDKASRTAMNAGGAVGNLVGSVQADSVQGHGHDFFVGNTASGFGHGNTFSQLALADDAGGRTLQSTRSGAQDIIQSLKTFGAFGTPRVSTESRPSNAYVLYCIKI